MKLVASLRDLGGADLALAGGKGANLGELVRSRFPVPDGFVVTTEAYATSLRAAGPRLPGEAAEQNGASGGSSGGSSGGAAAVGADGGAGSRAEPAAIRLPGEVRDAIVEAYAALGDTVPVAVRSSATAEDLPGAAFAGQQDTYLNVIGEDAVLDAVRRCWASLWNERAVAYREKRGIDSGEVGIAVVVQAMVDADTAGVMLTADPVSGHRERIVVEAGAGLGEAVVSGQVTPDHYVLDRSGRLLEWSPGRREVVIRSASGGGVTRDTGDPGRSVAERPPSGEAQPEKMPPEKVPPEKVPPEKVPPEKVLSADVLVELARLGTEVARHFGRPQDIEWAYADGRVQLLQARPMTALPPPPLRLNRAQRRLGSVLVEYFPVRPYPIDASTWVPYGPAGLMAEVTGYFGIGRAFDDFLPEVDGVVDRIVPPSPHPTARVLLAPFRLVSMARRYDPSRWTEDPRFVGYQAAVRDLARQDLTAMSWSDLLRVAREALALVRPVAGLRISYLPRSGLAILRLAVGLALLRRKALLGDLLIGARTRTTDANQALEALAGQVRADPRLRAAVAELDLEQLAEFAEFRAAFEDFRYEYGHRETVSPLLVTPPTWGDAPETVLGMVNVLAGRAESPGRENRPRPAAEGTAGPVDEGAEPGGGAEGRSAAALHRLLAHPLLGGPRRQSRVRRWVEQARAGVAFREDSHFFFTQPMPILRRGLLEIGRRLTEGGVLEEPEEVFHLRLEELEACADPAAGLAEADREAMRTAVRVRKARREELSGVPLIDPASIFPPVDRGEALVVGAPVGGGAATGPVTVVRGPEEFGKLNAGDVLVCPYTNPSWTPLFQSAAAVVVDSGGVASHAAIVAREYGIPAVMGTADGTRVLADGQVVTVDGTSGRVTAADS